jgi:hypothetical protein
VPLLVQQQPVVAERDGRTRVPENVCMCVRTCINALARAHVAESAPVTDDAAAALVNDHFLDGAL